MPIIKVSAQDMKKADKLPDGWYQAVIKEIKVEPTKDKQGLNYNIYLLIDDKSKSGKEFKHVINEHAKGGLRPLWEAALSTDDEPFRINTDSDYAFDTDEVAGKPVQIKMIREPYQGDLVNKIKQFIPSHIDTSNIPF